MLYGCTSARYTLILGITASKENCLAIPVLYWAFECTACSSRPSCTIAT